MSEKIFSASKWEKLIGEEREKRMNYNSFFEIAEPHIDEIWADIGCGPGYFTLPLAKQVSSVFAVDISEEMLNVCKKRANENFIENIEYIKTDGEIIPLEDNSVDKVLLANVFHEFDNRRKVTYEINRILRMNGYVFIIDWKYEEMDFGPPLEHRVKVKEVMQNFIIRGFSFIYDWDLYETNYVLAFKKTKEKK